jgi:pimeloyl-ACP methyl ester carboxylesterase
MRSKVTKIGEGESSEVFRIEPGTVVKLFRPRYCDERSVAREYATAKNVGERSDLAPRVFERVEIDGRPGYAAPGEDPLTRDWPLPFRRRVDAEEFLTEWTSSSLEYDYFMDGLVETPSGHVMRFAPHSMVSNITHECDWENLLPSIACPVLLLRSTGSGAVSDAEFTRMESLLPDCMAREIDNNDHNVHLSDRNAFYAIFDEFLRKVDG